MVSVLIDTDKCTACGTCIDACPSNVLAFDESDETKIAMVTAEENCSGCGACAIKCVEQAITVTGYDLLKVEPPPDYPPEQGRYLRGNDYSPVAVVAILDTDDSKIPTELADLVTTAVEAGAAIAGTLQTENLGIEKVVANIVANPNIRFMVVCWREAHGHSPAEALRCLVENGVANDKRRTIIGATAPTPYLANISLASIERFRKQLMVVNIIKDDDPAFGMLPENVKKAVHACIQEKPTKFESYNLYDPGAWPEPPICEKISIRLAEPWRPDLTSNEADIIEKMRLAGEELGRKRSKTVFGRTETNDNVLLEYLGLKKKSDAEKKEDEKNNERKER
ncbi:MAG: 4Fe-4S dicluster domain-containing protein [Candidatus Thorarchaeota archaeon]|nr:MAG: 4Fe-4S dicluster domain-containing protein [Candidatus Thorarchaeota archaeon]